MRRSSVVFCALLFSVGLGGLGFLGESGCSSDGVSCPAGQVACGSSCIASGTACPGDGLADLAMAEDPSLASLTTTLGQLSPAFQPSVTAYTLSLPAWAGSLQVQASPVDARATLTLNGAPLAAGTPSAAIALGATPTPIDVTVRMPGGAMRSYTVVVMRAPATYVKASNTGTGDAFGSVLALSGDTLAVSAPTEDSNATGVGGDGTNNGATNSGAVYVFVRSGGVWAQQAYIKASNTEGGDRFGDSLALSGDTLAVGAPAEDSSAMGVGGDPANNGRQNSGAVFVFQRTGTTWAQQAYLKSSTPDPEDRFGSSVALDGDTLAVSALGEDSSAVGIGGNQADNTASASGAVYVFLRTGTTWAQQAYVKASNTAADDRFGESLALSGDTLAVGASGEDSSATGLNGAQTDNNASASGAVYVFLRTGTTWAQQAYVKASNTATDDLFGASLALSGDTLAVGATGEDSSATGLNGAQGDNGASSSGAVYVFQRTGTTWAQQAYVKASNTEANDQFGSSVALSGDMLAVGARLEDSSVTGVSGAQTDNNAQDSGAVYLFSRTGTTWAQQSYVKASNTGGTDQFGGSVALSGGLLAVGGTQEDSSATGIGGVQTDNNAQDSGAVYLLF